jgi:signal peptidase I
MIVYMVGLTSEQHKHSTEKPGKAKKEQLPGYTQSAGGFILEIIKIVVITLAIVFPIRYFLFQPYYVQGASMEPNFHDYQYLIIDEITYRFSAPERGDVVVLKVPFEKEALIKRVIGLPNETIDIKNSQVTVYNSSNPNGFVLDETYLGPGITTDRDQRVVIGSDQYFVMGDNRPVSLDSRYFGPVTRKEIVGRAWLRVWPFNTFQHFVAPSYPNLVTNVNS